MSSVKTMTRVAVVFSVLLLSAGVASSYAQSVPRPEEVIGFEPGADFHLASYQQALEYFRRLEQVSSRIRLFEMGKTSMDKPMIYAVISSEDNIATLDRYKEISKKLALVRGVTAEEASRLAEEGRAVVYIDGGLHATEVAPAQHLSQLAYDLVTGEDSETRFIRENVILTLVFANPDGMDLVSEWYHSNVGTPYEVSPMPELYHKYVGHDNNRDSYMVNQVETQHLTRLVNKEWFPQVLYNQHQTGPFPARIWIPPNSEPTNPNIHPLVIRWQNLIGAAMGAAFEREDKPGVISRVRYDSWYPGYVTQVVDPHNVISILTETNLYRFATPHFYTLDDYPEEHKDFTMGVFYPNPWKGGWWRIGDAVRYNLTASKAVLHTAALYRETLLRNRYKMGADVMARFEKEPPHAWIIPREQWDPPTAALLLNKMMLLGIEVYEAEEGFVSDGISYPAGTWVIPMSQPFALFAKAVFEEQSYPDLAKHPSLWQGLVRPAEFPGAYLPPYDIAGWTLPYQMGVKALTAGSPLEAKLRPLEEVKARGGVEATAGYAYLISSRLNNGFIAVNRALGQGGEVHRSRASFRSGGTTYPAGSWLIRGVNRSSMDSLASELSLSIGATGGNVSAETYRIQPLKVALYKSWMANMDEGWTRWLLEQFEFPFTNIHDAEVRAGELGKRFDVIVIPSQSKEGVVHGHRKGTHLPQYVGGITEAGVRNIRAFIEGGGTLVTLNNACLFAIDELGLPVSDVLKGVRPPGRREPQREGPPKFACPGSLLSMEFDVEHPVAYGMPESAPAMFNRSPAFRVNPSFDEEAPAVIAKYPGQHLLQSGYLLGEEYLKNKVAAAELPVGEGRVILLGFGVQNRAQPHGTFKLLFNSLYYGSLGQ
jgi:hypothetical protein